MLRQRAEKLAERKCNLQPSIIVVGESWKNISDCYVCINLNKYKSEKLLDCFDLLFQCFHVYDLQYPLESRNVWSVIHEYLYKLPPTRDSTADQIITDLENHFQNRNLVNQEMTTNEEINEQEEENEPEDNQTVREDGDGDGSSINEKKIRDNNNDENKEQQDQTEKKKKDNVCDEIVHDENGTGNKAGTGQVTTNKKEGEVDDNPLIVDEEDDTENEND